jgi:hypothetical protein
VPHLRLSEADRERLGGPELLPFDLRGITNREAIEIAKLGYRTPSLFRKALFNVAEEGFDPLAWTGAVWMCLRRAGIEADIRALEFNVDELTFVPDEQPDAPPETEEPGKAPARSKGSTRTSSTGGATSRARSRSTSSRS